MVSNITKQSKSGGIDKVSKWRSPGRNIGVRVSELTGLDMVVTVVYWPYWSRYQQSCAAQHGLSFSLTIYSFLGLCTVLCI